MPIHAVSSKLRRRILTPFLATALVAICATPAADASDHSWLNFEARQWSAEPSGTLGFDAAFLSQTVDLTGDLGFEEDEALEGRLLFRPSRRTLIRVGYLPELALSGDSVFERSFQFLNQTFTVSERAVSSLEIEYGRLGFGWQLLSLAEGRLRFGPFIEAKGFRGTAALAFPEAEPAVTRSDEFETGFATAGVIANWDLTDRLELFGETTLFVEVDDGDLTDTEYGLRYRPLDYLGLVVGVRTLEVEIAENGQSLVLELDGMFFGLSFHL